MKKANYECPKVEMILLQVNDAIMASGFNLDIWDNATDRKEDIGV